MAKTEEFSSFSVCMFMRTSPILRSTIQVLGCKKASVERESTKNHNSLMFILIHLPFFIKFPISTLLINIIGWNNCNCKNMPHCWMSILPTMIENTGMLQQMVHFINWPIICKILLSCMVVFNGLNMFAPTPSLLLLHVKQWDFCNCVYACYVDHTSSLERGQSVGVWFGGWHGLKLFNSNDGFLHWAICIFCYTCWFISGDGVFASGICASKSILANVLTNVVSWKWLSQWTWNFPSKKNFLP